jgi:hypothetical protein
MRPSKPLVLFFTGALLFKEFDSQPFDQPHVHPHVEGEFLDFTVQVAASGSPDVAAMISTYPPLR